MEGNTQILNKVKMIEKKFLDLCYQDNVIYIKIYIKNDMRGAGRNQAGSSETKCYCSGFGHMARSCPTPGQRVCYVCFKPGHEVRDCPNRKKPLLTALAECFLKEN